MSLISIAFGILVLFNVVAVVIYYRHRRIYVAYFGHVTEALGNIVDMTERHGECINWLAENEDPERKYMPNGGKAPTVH